MRALRRHVRLTGARILEIGCGDGRLTRRIAGAARSVIAFDPNEALIVRARRATPAPVKQKVRYRIGAAENMRFPGHSVDVVLLAWSL